MDRLLNVHEVAAVIGCSASLVYQKVSTGEIPHLKVGQLVRFRAEDIEGWLEGQRRGVPA